MIFICFLLLEMHEFELWKIPLQECEFFGKNLRTQEKIIFKNLSFKKPDYHLKGNSIIKFYLSQTNKISWDAKCIGYI